MAIPEMNILETAWGLIDFSKITPEIVQSVVSDTVDSMNFNGFLKNAGSGSKIVGYERPIRKRLSRAEKNKNNQLKTVSRNYPSIFHSPTREQFFSRLPEGVDKDLALRSLETKGFYHHMNGNGQSWIWSIPNATSVTYCKIKRLRRKTIGVKSRRCMFNLIMSIKV